MKMTFLSAATPLTKTITLKNGVVTKGVIDMPYAVTSEEVTCTSLKDVFKAISGRSVEKRKPCILTGLLERPLTNESRRGMVMKDLPTMLLLFDLDGAPFSSHAEFMKAMGLDNVSYVWQWSSGAKIDKKDKTLNGHIFMMLDAPVQPKVIRAWLMHLNLTTDVLKNAATLTDAKESVHWALDVVVNDNGRPQFIAEPNFVGMANPIPSAERIQYIKNAEEKMPSTKIKHVSLEVLNKERIKLRDELRAKEGLDKIRPKLKVVGDMEVQTGVGEVTKYEVMEYGDYIRYNLGEGKSWAHWHPKDDAKYLRNFKGLPTLLLAEVLPDQARKLASQQRDMLQLPNDDGDVLLGFIEKRTAVYWKGIWNEAKEFLDIDAVSNKEQVHNYYMNHNLQPPPFIPEWRIEFNPQSPIIVDMDNQIVNTFCMPRLMRPGVALPGRYPLIQHAIDSAVGRGEIQEHFLNWLAVVLQHRVKTKTAWILHGTYGTGKGVLVNDVLLPVIGPQYCSIIPASALMSSFNGWKENKLLTLVDEIEVDIFSKGALDSDLKNLITEIPQNIHKKGQNMYSCDSFINLIFASNKPQPVHIPLGDRRFNVGVYQHTRWLPTRDEIEVQIPKEREGFMYYIMNRKADIDLARQCLFTEDKAAIQALGVTSIDEFANDILQGNLVKLWEYMPDERAMNEHGINDVPASAYANMMKRYVTEEQSNISREELQLLFTHAIGQVPPGKYKFTAYLRHHNIQTKKVWAGGISTYGIQVKWNITNAQRDELRAGCMPKRAASDKVRRVK